MGGRLGAGCATYAPLSHHVLALVGTIPRVYRCKFRRFDFECATCRQRKHGVGFWRRLLVRYNFGYL
jgi:hypothetical protein